MLIRFEVVYQSQLDGTDLTFITSVLVIISCDVTRGFLSASLNASFQNYNLNTSVSTPFIIIIVMCVHS